MIGLRNREVMISGMIKKILQPTILTSIGYEMGRFIHISGVDFSTIRNLNKLFKLFT